MNYFAYIIFFACTLMQKAFGVYPNHQNMANLLFKSHLSPIDTSRSVACFSNYIVTSNKLSESFSQDYNQCLLDIKAGREATEIEMLDKRKALENNSQDIWKRLSACDHQNTTLEFFHCHAKIGPNNTKDVYGISGNASEHANVLQEKYRILDVRHEQCCKAGERSYVASTANNYRNLQDCLDGRLNPTLTGIATTTTTTTKSTTAKPLSTISPKMIKSFDINNKTTSRAV